MSTITHPPKPFAAVANNSTREDNPSPQIANQSQQIFIEISEDEMSARVTVLPPSSENQKFATLNDVREALTQRHVVYGLNPIAMAEMSSKLARYAAAKDFNEMTEADVAFGTPVVNGQDAQIEYLYKKEISVSQVENLDNGRVDHHAAHKIDNVAKGSLLARKIPVVAGISGKTVIGTVISPAEGKDIALAVNKGVVTHPENPNEFYADADGQVIVKDGKLSVQAIYEIQGDVNLATGNIEFMGTVVVKGDVKDGFKIHAGEDIVVSGVVEGAELKAGGNITVLGGVSGNDKAHLICKGDATIKYIRNAVVEVGGCLTLSQAIMHSKVACDKKITVAGQKGMIVGGQIVAGQEVTAALIGCHFGTPTEIIVGETVTLRDQLLKIEFELKEMGLNMDKTKKALLFLKELHVKLSGNLPPDKKELLTKLTRVYFKLTADSKLLMEKKHELENKSKESHTEKVHAKVSCAGMIYPGAKITINRVMRQISEELKFCALTELAGEIKVGPLKG